MTLHQGTFVKAPLSIYVSKYEHLVDNAAILEFAKGSAKAQVYFMDNTHYFGKSEAVLDEIHRIA